MPISCLPETVPRAVASLHLSCSYSHQAALTEVFFSPFHSFCVYYLEFLKGNLSCFLLYFCQRAPVDIYFILRVVVIEASAFSCSAIVSCFGHCACSGWHMFRLPPVLPKDLPFLIFLSILNTLSILAPQNVPTHLVLVLPESWKQPCLQGIAVLLFGSLGNSICGVRTQYNELALPDALLPDSLNRAGETQASLRVSQKHTVRGQ